MEKEKGTVPFSLPESARLHDEKAMSIPFKGEGILVAYSGLEELSPDGVMTARGI